MRAHTELAEGQTHRLVHGLLALPGELDRVDERAVQAIANVAVLDREGVVDEDAELRLRLRFLEFRGLVDDFVDPLVNVASRFDPLHVDAVEHAPSFLIGRVELEELAPVTKLRLLEYQSGETAKRLVDHFLPAALLRANLLVDVGDAV